MAGFMKKGVVMVVGILVVAIMFSYLLPVAIDGMTEDETNTLNMSVAGNSQEVTANLEANLTEIDQTADPDEIHVDLNDTSPSGNSATLNDIGVGSNKTATMTDGDVTVHNVEVHDSGNASVRFSYPQDYGWSDGSSSLWGLIPLMVVMTALLLVIGRMSNAI